MILDELKMLIIQVITSWQVIAVTVVLFLYFWLVSYASRTHTRRSASTLSARLKNIKKRPPRPVGEPDVENPIDDDLGLEE
jgi:hypothetical protein